MAGGSTGGGSTGGGGTAVPAFKQEIVDYLNTTPLPDWEEIRMNHSCLAQIKDYLYGECVFDDDVCADDLLSYLQNELYPNLSGAIQQKTGTACFILSEDALAVLEDLNAFLSDFDLKFITDDFTFYALFSLDGKTKYFQTADGRLFDNLLPPELIQANYLHAAVGAGSVKTAYLGTKQVTQLYLGGSPLIR